jgi:glutamate 5-kinase
MSELRKKILDEARRIVIKIGSSILVDPKQGGVNIRYIAALADSVAKLSIEKK